MMDENKILEQLKNEAQSVDIPQELSPERMQEKLNARTSQGWGKTGGTRKMRSGFRYGSRAVAAALVLVLSLGAYRVAQVQPQPAFTGGELGDAQSVDDTMQPAASENLPAAEDEDASAEGAVTPAKTLGDYTRADSYEEIRTQFQWLADNYESLDIYATEDGAAADGVTVEEAREDSSSASMSNSMSASMADAQKKESDDYSGTNLQVQGVDESDIVKTDGHYIYIASDKEVQIVDVSTGTMRQLGSIKPELSGNLDRIMEMYLADDKLCLIVQTESAEIDAAADTGALSFSSVEDLVWNDSTGISTELLTYDVTAPAGAKLLGTVTMDGSYDSSRKIGDRIYLFSDYAVAPRRLMDDTEAENDEAGAFLPTIQGQTIPADCVYFSSEQDAGGVLIAAVDVNSPASVTDQKLIFLGYASFYVTGDSIYLYRNCYSQTSDSMVTRLTRFLIGDGKITADCAEAVPGAIQDTFAIHESGDGYLYVLTTDYFGVTDTNQLYVLDDRLKIYGEIQNIAEGEMVYAARFVDDIGYFVTYRNTDPLFTVDFSDRANPTLIGELEIPGFSDYLQFWDDTHLIGVGEETDEDSNFMGIKVSLYDIADPTNVKETSKIVMSDMNYAPATSSYKALLADSGKNVIAFLTAHYGTEGERYYQQILSVEDGKLLQQAAEQLADIDGFESNGNDIGSYRDLYIGDRLYLAGAGQVISYDLTTYEREEILQLN